MVSLEHRCESRERLCCLSVAFMSGVYLKILPNEGVQKVSEQSLSLVVAVICRYIFYITSGLVNFGDLLWDGENVYAHNRL